MTEQLDARRPLSWPEFPALVCNDHINLVEEAACLRVPGGPGRCGPSKARRFLYGESLYVINPSPRASQERKG